MLHKQREPWSNWLKPDSWRCVVAPAIEVTCFRLPFTKLKVRKSLTPGRLDLIDCSMSKWCWAIYAIMGAFGALKSWSFAISVLTKLPAF